MIRRGSKSQTGVCKMKVLVINCGSSSLKFQLIDGDTEELTAKGLCERIGIAGSRISFTKAGCEKKKWEAPMACLLYTSRCV